ncbi:hypothetical protein Tco_0971928 [Tanacetum coccineum]
MYPSQVRSLWDSHLLFLLLSYLAITNHDGPSVVGEDAVVYVLGGPCSLILDAKIVCGGRHYRRTLERRGLVCNSTHRRDLNISSHNPTDVWSWHHISLSRCRSSGKDTMGKFNLIVTGFSYGKTSSPSLNHEFNSTTHSGFELFRVVHWQKVLVTKCNSRTMLQSFIHLVRRCAIAIPCLQSRAAKRKIHSYQQNYLQRIYRPSSSTLALCLVCQEERPDHSDVIDNRELKQANSEEPLFRPRIDHIF